LLHRERMVGKPRPWLRMTKEVKGITKNVPKDATEAVIEIMRTTRFCHPDRYLDRVSLEIEEAVVACGSMSRALAIAISVRFKGSPKGLAGALVGCDDDAFPGIVKAWTRPTHTYRQTGVTDENLSVGVLKVSNAIEKGLPCASRAKLELDVGRAVKRICSGTKTEYFAARQVAADLCVQPGYIHGATCRPEASKLGPGSKAGWYWGERASGESEPSVAPKELPYQEQTERCEYSKLVKRLTFPELCTADGCKYVPFEACA
jgi:hypothetical protein